MPLTEAELLERCRQEGRNAFGQGGPYCPYDDQQAYLAWWEGYTQAEQDALNK